MAQSPSFQRSPHESEKSTPLPYSGPERRIDTSTEIERRLQRAMDAGQMFSWELNFATQEFSFSENIEDVRIDTEP